MAELTTYERVEFDEEGFRCFYLKRKVRWKDVIRVARMQWVFPDALWFQECWAFQTSDPEFLISVEDETISGMRFGDEVRRRYRVPDIFSTKDWIDNKMLVKTFVIYPEVDFGKPLYRWIKKKKNWYSSEYDVEFYQS